MRITWCLLTVFLLATGPSVTSAPADERMSNPSPSWKAYTNARFGFSIRYPTDWRLGDPFPDGAGISMTPTAPKSQLALTGFLNLVEGTSQDRRQTLDEFVKAHYRIIGEYYGKKTVTLKWKDDQSVTLGGFPAKQLSFSYLDEAQTEIVELHIFSLGRNEGRGVRIKFPASSRAVMMPVVAEMLRTYLPGRDQNAVSPFAPKEGAGSKENAR